MEKCEDVPIGLLLKRLFAAATTEAEWFAAKRRFVLRMFPVNEQGVFQFGFSCEANLNSIMRMRLCPPLKILASSPYPVVYE